MGSPARCPGAGVGLGLSPGLWPGLPVGARAPSCPDECSAGAQSCPVWHLVTARCVRHPQPGAVRGPGVCPPKRAWSNTPFIPLGSSSLSPPPLPVPGWGRPLWAEAAGTQPRSHQAAEMRSVFTLLAIDRMGDRMHESRWENLGNWSLDSKDGRRLETLILKP